MSSKKRPSLKDTALGFTPPGKAEERFAAADKTMQQGGYAGKPAAPKPSSGLRKPTSWSATPEDLERIREIRTRMLVDTGGDVTKTDVVRAGLVMLYEAGEGEWEARLRRALAEVGETLGDE